MSGRGREEGRRPRWAALAFVAALTVMGAGVSRPLVAELGRALPPRRRRRAIEQHPRGRTERLIPALLSALASPRRARWAPHRSCGIPTSSGSTTRARTGFRRSRRWPSPSSGAVASRTRSGVRAPSPAHLSGQRPAGRRAWSSASPRAPRRRASSVPGSRFPPLAWCPCSVATRPASSWPWPWPPSGVWTGRWWPGAGGEAWPEDSPCLAWRRPSHSTRTSWPASWSSTRPCAGAPGPARLPAMAGALVLYGLGAAGGVAWLWLFRQTASGRLGRPRGPGPRDGPPVLAGPGWADPAGHLWWPGPGPARRRRAGRGDAWAGAGRARRLRGLAPSGPRPQPRSQPTDPVTLRGSARPPAAGRPDPQPRQVPPADRRRSRGAGGIRRPRCLAGLPARGRQRPPSCSASWSS